MEKNSQSWLILLFVHGFESKTISIRCVCQCNPHLLRKTQLVSLIQFGKTSVHIVTVQA